VFRVPLVAFVEFDVLPSFALDLLLLISAWSALVLTFLIEGFLAKN